MGACTGKNQQNGKPAKGPATAKSFSLDYRGASVGIDEFTTVADLRLASDHHFA
jgi:hypothetical protein